ncbi:hypothetical protein RUM43_001106 [Polyplax serrata]|uniref:Peptidase S1 domain-containing protein n=1 Tax=Polyplax serrata TaxID=468196 RepID=A0AAN8SDB1_POLSC
MSATSSGGSFGAGGGSVSEGSDAGESSQSTMTITDCPSTSFHIQHENTIKLNAEEVAAGTGVHVGMMGSKINLTVDEMQEASGEVNMGFDLEEGVNNSNAEFKSVSGSKEREKVPEAVNLELVNMVPYSNGNSTSLGVPVNGIPVKKDSEGADMSSPYDEYFVPVNEHKKYMRGEKLYVTKDKRRPTSWRRCLSWIVACAVISVVLIVGILAATGVILSQEPNVIQEASVGRNFAGPDVNNIHTGGSSDNSVDKTISGPLLSSGTNVTHTYVPRSIQSELTIDNLEWNPAFLNQNSSEYQQLAKTIENQLKLIFFNSETLDFQDSNVALNVFNISQDPLQIWYRIGWIYKQGATNQSDPITMEEVKMRLTESLMKTQGYIDRYHINMDEINIGHVINLCQINNGGCSHICFYNYLNQQFMCSCPINLVLDSSFKKCVEWAGTSEEDYGSVPNDNAEVHYESGAEGSNHYGSGHHHHHHHHHPWEHGAHNNTSIDSSEAYEQELQNAYENTESSLTASGTYKNEQEGDIVIHGDTTASKYNASSASDAAEHNQTLDKFNLQMNAGGKNSGDSAIHTEYDTAVQENNKHVHLGNDKVLVYSTAEETYTEAGTLLGSNNTHDKSISKTGLGSNSEHFEHIAPNGGDNSGLAHEVDQYTTNKTESSAGSHQFHHHDHDGMNTERIGFGQDYDIHSTGTVPGTEIPGNNADKKEYPSDTETEFKLSEVNPNDHNSGLPSHTNRSVPGSLYEHIAVPVVTTNERHEEINRDKLNPPTGAEFTSDRSIEDTRKETTSAGSVTFGSQDSNAKIYNENVEHKQTKGQSNAAFGSVSGSTGGLPVDEELTTTSWTDLHDNTNTDGSNFTSNGGVGAADVHHNHGDSNPASIVSETLESNVNKTFPASIAVKQEEGSHKTTFQLLPSNIGVTENTNKEFQPDYTTISSNQASTNYDTNTKRTDSRPNVEQNTQGGSTYFSAEVIQNTSKIDGSSATDVNAMHYTTMKPDSETLPVPSGKTEVYHSGSSDSVPNLDSTRDSTEANDRESMPSLTKNEKNDENIPVHTVTENINFRPQQVPLTEHSLLNNSSPVVTENVKINKAGQTNVEENEKVNPNVENTSLNKTSQSTSQMNDPNILVHTIAVGSTTVEGNSNGENFGRVTEIIPASSGMETNPNDALPHFKENPLTYSTTIKGSHRETSDTEIPSIDPSGVKQYDTVRVNESSNLPHMIAENTANNRQTETKIGSGFQSDPNYRTTESSGFDGFNTEVSARKDSMQDVDTTNVAYSHNEATLTVTTMIPNTNNETTLQVDRVTELTFNETESKIRAKVQNQQNPLSSNSDATPSQTTQTPIAPSGNTEDSQLKKDTPLSGTTEPIKTSTDSQYETGLNLAQSRTSETVTNRYDIVTSPTNDPLLVEVTGKEPSYYGDFKKTQHHDSNEPVEDQLVQHGGPSTVTIKHPHDFTNNIKDIGLESDEFNTLLGEDYKHKNEYPNNGKETLNKYANKQTFLKSDKKKHKDILKGDKVDYEKNIGEGPTKSSVKPDDFTYKKNINENSFTVGYAVQTEPKTTEAEYNKTDNNPTRPVHSPDIYGQDSSFETDGPTHFSYENTDYETEIPTIDSKVTVIENKDPDDKTDRDYAKFDKDFKHGKNGKKKETKKKLGGKDGKNVEIEELRKHHDVKYSSDTSEEDSIDFSAMSVTPSLEIITTVPGDENNRSPIVHSLDSENRPNKPFEDHSSVTSQTDKTLPKEETTERISPQKINSKGTEAGSVSIVEHPIVTEEKSHGTVAKELPDLVSEIVPTETVVLQSGTESQQTNDNIEKEISGKKLGTEQIISHAGTGQTGTIFGNNVAKNNQTFGREHIAISTTGPALDGERTVYQNYGSLNQDERNLHYSGTPFGVQNSSIVTHGGTGIEHKSGSSSFVKQYESNGERNLGTNNYEAPGTDFSGITVKTVYDEQYPFGITNTQNTTTYGTTFGHTEGSTERVTDSVLRNGSLVEERHMVTIQNGNINHSGQSEIRQDGQDRRLFNLTSHTVTNSMGPITRITNTTTLPGGVSYTVRNYTYAGGNPTVIVRQHSTNLPDSRVIRFNTTQTFVTPPGGYNGTTILSNRTIYKILNGSLPERVYEENFNPQNGRYHMYTNSSGTFVYSNSQPSLVIKGDSGDFGRSAVYILGNRSFPQNVSTFPKSHHVVFKNSTVFAVQNVTHGDVPPTEVEQKANFTLSNSGSNKFTFTPSAFAAGTTYKISDHFGYVSKCAAGQFQCVNGTSKRGSACISLSSKCDSINDCFDGSDEIGCIENGCPGNFQCSNGTCLKRHLVCNGIVDCTDGSDEKNCENWKCEFDEFQCPSGRCIPVVWQCDSKADCDNHTDEQNCHGSCGNDEFLCPEGWCVPLTFKCNGIKDCSNGEDEQFCDCSLEEFKCKSGGCISKNQVCDGLDDCPDRSDEWDCLKLESNSTLLKIRTPSGVYVPVCADNWSETNSIQVCASLGYSSFVPVESDSSISAATEDTLQRGYYTLKNETNEDENSSFLRNLVKTNKTCSSGKLVELSCQEFSCGSRSMTDSSSAEGRLVGGMSATAGQWPSVALLYNVRNLHSCTASILTPRWVLASYNCLKMDNKNLNEQDWKLFGGATTFDTDNGSGETRKIIAIIPHPRVKFNQFLFSNDLALVKIEQPLLFSSNTGAICLPEQEIQPRQICVTAGWGMNSPEDKNIRQQLQYLPVPTMNLTDCNSTEHYSGFITDDKICAGYNVAEKSLCYNEEGAPLMCVNDRGEWELQGTMSYHSNCGRGSHPSIFNNITPALDWIKQTIGNSFQRKIIPPTKR